MAQIRMIFAILRERMTYYFRVLSPATCPLFTDLAPEMLRSLPRSGISLPGEGGCPEAELWDYLKNQHWLVLAGERCSTNRFMSAVSAARDNLPNWYIDLFERLFLAIELDFVRAKQLLEKIVRLRPGRHEEGGESAPTNANAITIET
jgi:hypothetical protein